MKIKRVIEIEETNCKLLESRNLTLDTTTMLKASKRDIESSVAVLDLIYALKESKPYEERPQVKSDHFVSYTKTCHICGYSLATYNPEDYKFCPRCGMEF